MAKHGYASRTNGRQVTPTYASWQMMIQRCHNPKNHGFHNYGGRGIKVCERWRGLGGFENFLADMGERPPGTSIDRIDSNGNYTHLNCRWATSAEQSWNRRNNKLEPHEVDQFIWLTSLGYRQVQIAAFYETSQQNVSHAMRARRRKAAA